MKSLSLLTIALFISFSSFSQVSSSNLRTVYRFFHNDGDINTSRHFYTTTPNELTGCNCGPWVGESSLGLLKLTNPGSVDKPVYRFNRDGTHYYSDSFSAPSGFVFESILGYYQSKPTFVYIDEQNYPLRPVKEYLSPWGDYLYTINDNENPGGWTFKRIAFYVHVYAPPTN